HAIVRPPAQRPSRGGDTGERDEKDPRQLKCSLAFPLAAEFMRQWPEPVAPREEVVFQDRFIGRVNQPVSLLRTRKQQAARGVTFNVQTVQRELEVGSVR